MIYMEPASLGWKVQTDSWFNKFPEHLDESHKSLLRTLFQRHVDFVYALINKKLVQELQSTSRKAHIEFGGRGAILIFLTLDNQIINTCFQWHNSSGL